ncbi:MAG TPA: nuclease-related domain-containing protein [Streptosporangiaceae bacterium]|nr:nuclease-related domain-containing protein [Streptosporangiaceae bacterium]
MDLDSGTEPQPAGTAPADEAEASQQRFPASARSVRESLTADPRMSIWIRRAVMALVAGIAVTIWQNWRWGVTAAAVVAIVDTIYQSKAMSPIPADVLATSAQRRTRRRVLLLRAAGYQALHSRAIPGSDQVIDHLVIGPAGVFAVDSERWDRRLPVRTTGAPTTGVLYHGPFSQSQRLAHARWEAAQAGRLIGDELRQPLNVSPAMVIYGPTIPWGVATLRGVEVFSGKRVRKFFRSQNRATRGQHLDEQEIELIYQAAERALPPAR